MGGRVGRCGYVSGGGGWRGRGVGGGYEDGFENAAEVGDLQIRKRNAAAAAAQEKGVRGLVTSLDGEDLSYDWQVLEVSDDFPPFSSDSQVGGLEEDASCASCSSSVRTCG